MRYTMHEKAPGESPKGTETVWHGEPSDDLGDRVGAFEREAMLAVTAGLTNMKPVAGSARWATNTDTGEFIFGACFITSRGMRRPEWRCFTPTTARAYFTDGVTNPFTAGAPS